MDVLEKMQTWAVRLGLFMLCLNIINQAHIYLTK